MDTGQMMVGHASKRLQKFRQIGTTDGHVTANFYGFTPIADTVLTTLLDKGSHDAKTYNSSSTWNKDVYYPGQFIAIRVTSGSVIMFLGEE